MRFSADLGDIFTHQHVNIFAGRECLNIGTYYQEAIRFCHSHGVAGTLPW